jgi:phage/plasmid-associated DNA primase
MKSGSPINSVYHYNPKGYKCFNNSHIKSNINELIKSISNKNECAEFLTDDMTIKPYFDFDWYCTSQEEVEKNKLIKYEVIKTEIGNYFIKYHNETQFSINEKMIFGEKHGLCVLNGKYKISWRLWVLGYKTTVPKMKALVDDETLFTSLRNEDGGIDTAPYGKTQKMKMINSYKSETEDTRILRYYPHQHNIEDSIIQHVEDDCIELITPKKTKLIIPKQKIKKTQYDKYNDDYKTFVKFDTHLKKLCLLINKKYLEPYDTWKQMAMALHYTNESIGLNILNKMNKLHQIIPSSPIEDFWNGLRKRTREEPHYGLGTLIHYAKLSDPVATAEIVKLFMNSSQCERMKALCTITGITHSIVATCFKTEYPNKYVYSQKTWYRCNKYGIYEELYDPDASIIKELEKFIRDILWKAYNATNGDEDYTDARKKLLDSLKRIEDVEFGYKCIKKLKSEYLDDEFCEKIDEKVHLIGFKNGVYDLEQDVFRLATKEDAVKKTVGYDYEVVSGEEMDKAENIIRGWFDSKELQDYILRLCGGLCYGGNPEQYYYFFSGSGSNGKGIFCKILEETFTAGEYFSPLDVSYFTTKKSTASANPYLQNIKGARVTMSVEPNEGEIMYGNKFKELTGDRITARLLHKNPNPKGFIPQNKHIFQCNEKPKFDEKGDGLLRRIKVVPFEKKYVETDDFKKGIKHLRSMKKNGSVRKDEFFIEKDQHFFTKNPLIPIVYMNLFLKWYKVYKVKNCSQNIPEEVNLHTNEYKDEIDKFPKWWTDNYTLTDDKTNKIRTSDISKLYTDEYKENLTPNQLGTNLKDLGIPIVRQRVLNKYTNKTSRVAVVEGFIITPPAKGEEILQEEDLDKEEILDNDD